MCRLSLLSSDTPIGKNESYLFALMMFLSQREGNSDGTGLAYFDPPLTRYLKTKSPATKVIYDDAWNGMFDNIQEIGAKDVWGHCRMASVEFKPKAGEDNKDGDAHAHPHVIGNLVVMHNGKFNEWRRMAQEIGLSAEGLTDSAVFTQYLYHELQESKTTLNPEIIKETLLKCGECEYSLLIVQSGQNCVWVVRGWRDLYYSSFGGKVLVNTDKRNIEDAFTIAGFHLKRDKINFNFPVDSPKQIPVWEIWKAESGTFEKILDITGVAKVNNRTCNYNQFRGYHGAVAAGDDETTFFQGRKIQTPLLPAPVSDPRILQAQDKTEKPPIVNGAKDTGEINAKLIRAKTIADIGFNFGLDEEELYLITEALYHTNLWETSGKDLFELDSFFEWLEKKGIITVDDIGIWEAWKDEVESWEEISDEEPVPITMQYIYEMAESCIETTFEFPYFMNDVAELSQFIATEKSPEPPVGIKDGKTDVEM